MSRNLVELVRRHHEHGAPTALTVLKAALDDHGEITDDDRRLASELSGLPEAAVHGVSTFYDDLLQPRGARHVRVCTGTACFATTADAHVDALREAFGCELGERAADGSVSLAETVCLGFCHSSPAIRDGDVVDAGPGVVERVLAGKPVAGREPPPRAAVDAARPARVRARLDRACRARSRRCRPRTCSRRSRPRTSAAAAAPASRPGTKWEFARAAAGERKFIVANGDEGDPGSYIDKVLMEQHPELAARGHGARGLRRRRRPRLHPHALGVPALQAAPGRRRGGGAQRGRARPVRPGHATSPSTSRSSRAPARTSSARRRRCSRACRAARDRLGAPAVPRAARPARHADGRQQRRDALQHPGRRADRRGGVRALEPRADVGHEARLLQRALRRAGRLRGRVRR